MRNQRGIKLKQVLEILSAKNKSDVGKKSGKPYSMNVCQCVVTDGETGDIQVGELAIFDEISKLPAPGLYEAEFKIGVDFQTKKIGGVLVGLTPYTPNPNIASNKPAANVPSLDKGKV